jgi:hypoxanthine phosphoribosyltransferase
MDPVPELISASRIAERVEELAGEIAGADGADGLHVVVVLNGAFVFAADLLRAFDRRGARPGVDFLAVSSYGDGTESSGDVQFRCPPKCPVEGRDVLLLDDILDTGRSLGVVKRWLERHGAARVRTCVLLDKPARRVAEMEVDFRGFEVPDRFLVGYGLDHAERYRHLPYVGYVDA